MPSAALRDLEQIQERDDSSRPSRLLALLLASLGTAAIVSAGVVMAQRSGPPAAPSADPLAELVANAKSLSPAERLDGHEVTFPGVLSDGRDPTTALAAVQDERGRLVRRDSALEPPTPAPPPATDQLPVVPLPVGTMLGATTVTTTPKDELTVMAADAAKIPDTTELAPPGSDGGFALQVASFKDAPDADRLVEDLRRRGHRAYRQAAYVPERGLWHRVRIGPFKSSLGASKYKAEFETTERMSPFVVDPEKVKRAEESRAIRVESRKQKKAAQAPEPEDG